MKRDPAPKVIMLTGGGTIENAVELIKKGAYDFLTKPVKLDDLARLIKRACETHQLEKENQQLKEVIKRQVPGDELIGQSPAMMEVFRLIERTAASSKPVLIQGESGTGKELVARAIHNASPLADKPLVVINCACWPSSSWKANCSDTKKAPLRELSRPNPVCLKSPMAAPCLLTSLAK